MRADGRPSEGDGAVPCVYVVDDDEIGRLGRELVLRRLGQEVVATTWADLATRLDRGTAPDLVLAVVRRDRSQWDRYVVLRSAGDLRAAVGPDTRLVAAGGEAELDNPLLGLRLVASGFEELLHRDDLASAGQLAALVSGAVRGFDPRPGPADLAVSNVGPRSDPARVVERLAELAEDDPAYLRAFQPGYRQNQCGLTRRRAHTLRVKVALMGDLQPDPARSLGGPVRDQSLPRWTEMVAFVNACRGWEPGDDTVELFNRRGPVDQKGGTVGRTAFAR